MKKESTINYGLELMKVSEAVYLTTIGSDGFPETKAMLNLRNVKNYPGLKDMFQKQGEDFLTYFTTNRSSPKIERIKKNHKACVYYCKPEEWRGMNISGTIEVIDDTKIKGEMWQDNWNMYYPMGVEDPDYTLLRLKPRSIKGYHQFQQYTLDINEE